MNKMWHCFWTMRQIQHSTPFSEFKILRHNGWMTWHVAMVKRSEWREVWTCVIASRLFVWKLLTNCQWTLSCQWLNMFFETEEFNNKTKQQNKNAKVEKWSFHKAVILAFRVRFSALALFFFCCFFFFVVSQVFYNFTIFFPSLIFSTSETPRTKAKNQNWFCRVGMYENVYFDLLFDSISHIKRKERGLKGRTN